MTDIVDGETRSRMMASIRGKNTKPELRVRHGLHRLGLRYRLHYRGLPGRPDLVLPRFRVALFVHGCYWHRHAGCRFASRPVQNAEWWNQKFAANVARDQRQIEALQKAGWRVLVIWECALRTDDVSPLLVSVASEIRSGSRCCREWPDPAVAPIESTFLSQ